MLRTSHLNSVYRTVLVRPLARAALALGLLPHHLSLVAMGFAIAACALLAFDPFWGGVLVILSGYIDTLDGEMARTSNTAERAGAFLDSMLDRYSDFLYVLGILFHFFRMDALDITVFLLILFLSFGVLMGNYAQARAEGLHSSCSVGFFERPEWIGFLGLSAILNGLFPIEWPAGPPLFKAGVVLGAALIVLTAGTNWMALRRLHYGFNRLNGRENAREEARD